MNFVTLQILVVGTQKKITRDVWTKKYRGADKSLTRPISLSGHHVALWPDGPFYWDVTLRRAMDDR
jgi:hypothetical protein